MQLLAHANSRNGGQSSVRFIVRRDEVKSGRTRLSGFLRARHLDGLFGIVNVFWPVVIEWFELHGW